MPSDPAALLPSLPREARLLLLRMRSLGDAVLLTPAVRALKRWRPDLRLSVVLYRRFAPILAGHPDFDEVLALDAEGPAGPLAVAKLADVLQRRRFAACFNLHGGTLSAVLTRASGAPVRVGFGHFRFRFAYTALADEPRRVLGRDALHTAEYQWALFRWVGLPASELPAAQLFPQPEARAAVAARLAALGLAESSIAVLHPIANFFTKEWPAEHYAALAQWLEAERGLAPVFVCGPGESAKLEAVERAAGRRLVRLEGLSLPELVALLEGAALFVGNDSGPAHIAAALGRPVVVLFGSSNSTAWGPWRATGATVQNSYDCNPCAGDRCYAFARPECILSITPEQVRAAVERVLAAGPPRRTGVR